jgi:hypothetical protein
MPAAQWFLSILTIGTIGISGTIRIVAALPRCVVSQCVPRARTLLRQHFLKRDAVFLGVLVYSG